MALLAATLFLAAFVTPTQAAAPSNIPVLLRPTDARGDLLNGSGYYQVTARPGTLIHLDAFIGNRGRVRAQISLVPVDATSGVYGAVSYDLPQQPRHHVGAWVRLSRHRVSLAAGEGMVVPFALRVPRGTTPGQYVGALTAFVPAGPHRLARGIGLTVQTRVFTAILITVPGPTRARLSVTRVGSQMHSDQLYVVVHIRNSGNLLLQAHGFLWVYAPWSRKPWIHRPFYLDTTVPHTMVHYPLFWAKRVPHARYRYAVQLHWNRGGYSPVGRHEEIRWSGGMTVRRGYFWTP